MPNTSLHPLYHCSPSRPHVGIPYIPPFSVHWLLISLPLTSVHSFLVSSLLFFFPVNVFSISLPPPPYLFLSDMMLFLFIPPLLPHTPPSSPTSLPPPLLLLPLPPALVDGARDLCHDFCGSSARLRAHRDHKQLPHSDKVMDHKIKNAWHWLTRSMFSFQARGLYTHTDGLQCSNNIGAGRDVQVNFRPSQPLKKKTVYSQRELVFIKCPKEKNNKTFFCFCNLGLCYFTNVDTSI